MGTFMGHVLPGSFFIFFGIWHIVNLYARFFKCKIAGKRFYSTATFTCINSRFPIEGVLKIVATTIGSIGEIKTGYRSETGTVIPGNSQHVTMFSAFGLSGVVDCLVFYRVLWLPAKTEYALSALAFSVEGLLFAFHQHPGGHSILEMTIHTLLLYVVILTVIAIMAEIVCSHSFLLSIFRATLLVIQGTWFIQIGFILFPPWNGQITRWNDQCHDSQMYSVMMFCFNVFACLAITALVGSIVRKGVAPASMFARAAERKTGNSASQGGTPGLSNVNSDSDSECDLFVPTRAVHPP